MMKVKINLSLNQYFLLKQKLSLFDPFHILFFIFQKGIRVYGSICLVVLEFL